MKRALLVVGAVGVAVVCASAVGLAAQDAGARGGRGAGGITPDKSGKVNVDGCVQNPPAGSTSTSKYILTGVRATPRGRGAADPEATGGAAAESAAPATGTDAAAPGAAAAGGTGGGAARGRGAPPAPAPQIRYQLDGDEKVITPHLNHVVEIVGTLTGDPPPPARGGGGAGPGAPAPITQTLKIESLKMVAALCQ